MMYPSEIVLEVTNRCNLRCMFCHFHGIGAHRRRKVVDMDPNIWKKVVKEIASWERPVSVATHGAGEPLLYKYLRDLLLLLGRIPHVTFGFMTNGMLLSKDWSEFIVDIGMDWIAFSVDGVDPKKHAYYRRNSDLGVIEKNIENLLEIKEKRGSQKPDIIFNMVVYPGMEKEKERYLERWLPYSKKIMFSRFRPIPQKTLWKEQPFDFSPCPLIFRQVVIGSSGKMGLCCEDIHLEMSPGSVRENTILELFNGEFMRVVREKHLKGNIKDLPLCSSCHIWGAEKVLNRKVLDNSIVHEITPAYEAFSRV